MSHTCHARGCAAPVPPRMLMCRRHWTMVPRELQNAVLKSYLPGQEVRKNPTAVYLETARTAILAVFAKEQAKAGAERARESQGTLF